MSDIKMLAQNPVDAWAQGYEQAKAQAAAEIERLRAALRDIEEDSFSIYARDIARAALAAPSGALEERT